MKTDDQQWIKLFRYLDKRFREVDDRFTKQDEKFDRILTSVDGLAKRVVDDDIERAAMQHQLNRHEGQFQQLGTILDIDFS
jgi:predicted  nucleic acid-binding Zn-ribbon protein